MYQKERTTYSICLFLSAIFAKKQVSSNTPAVYIHKNPLIRPEKNRILFPYDPVLFQSVQSAAPVMDTPFRRVTAGTSMLLYCFCSRDMYISFMKSIIVPDTEPPVTTVTVPLLW